MTRRLRFLPLPLLATAMVLTSNQAFAQVPWTDRGYVNVSGWFQPTASFSDVVHPLDFVETTVVETGYRTGSVPGFEAGGGVRVWRHLGAGVSVSRFSKSTDGAVSAQVPHPFFFNRLRAVSGDAAGLTRDETAIHVQLSWVIPFHNRWQLAINGGPSWFTVGQDLVSDVTITQTYPFDTAAFSGVTSAHHSASRAGFNAGFDTTYRLAPHVGLGGGVTFSRASVPLSDNLKVDAGGAHLNAGIRFRF